MVDLAIIADDLTGALDAAAPFAMQGLKTTVATRPAALQAAIASGASVVGVSTDSRDLAPGEAREAVRRAVALLPSGVRLFKKIDSRLKGNVEVELDPIPFQSSLVVPAIPAFGRWVRAGYLGGFGILEPIDIRARLGRHGITAWVPDVSTQDDIEAALRLEFDLLIGARGLAEAVARSLAPNPEAPDSVLPATSTFVIIGSTDPITLAQVDNLVTDIPSIAHVLAPNGRGPNALPDPAPITIIQAVPDKNPATGHAVAMALAQTLARIAPPAGSLLVVSGGATAQALFDVLEIDVLDVVGEALPGLPIVRGAGLTVVTKSGGFGDPNTLSRLLTPVRSAQERIA